MEIPILQVKVGIDEQLIINKHNVSEVVARLLVAFEANEQIEHPFDALSNHKYFGLDAVWNLEHPLDAPWNPLHGAIWELINIMAIQIMIKIKEGFKLFLINDVHYNISRIKNTEFFLRILLNNNLVVKQFMHHEELWKPLFNLFETLLLRRSEPHRCVLNAKFVALSILLIQTQSRWGVEHSIYCKELGIFKILCLERSIMIKRESVLSPLFMWISIYDGLARIHGNNHIKSWFNNMDFFMQLIVWNLTSKQKHITERFISDSIRDISSAKDYKILLNTLKAEKGIISRLCKKVKLCANCGRFKTKKNKIKMKICEGCVLVYYCSRKCQKYDWKEKHRIQCEKLAIS